MPSTVTEPVSPADEAAAIRREVHCEADAIALLVGLMLTIAITITAAVMIGVARVPWSIVLALTVAAAFWVGRVSRIPR